MIRETQQQRDAVKQAKVYIWFRDAGDFKANDRAEAFLRESGFSLGHMQKGSPRGILFGDFDIQKWGNLSSKDRSGLHGEMTGDYRNGPVAIWIRPNAPPEALAALRRAGA